MESVIPIFSPDPTADSFTLPDGTVYTATESLSVARYKVFQKHQVAFGFNHTFGAFCQELDKAWAALEAGQMGTAAQTLGNLRDAVSYAGVSRFTGEEIVSLFYNIPGENPAVYDLNEMKAKWAAWEAAGIDASFFFQQAARRVPDFYQRFMRLSPPPLDPASLSPPPLPAE